MRRRIVMCALCVCMLGAFLYIGYENQKAPAARGELQYGCGGILLFSRTEQEGSTVHKTLYQIDNLTGNIIPLRSYALNREEKTLEIYDELRHRVLFSGSVLLNGEGIPENRAYFDCFFGPYSYVTKPRKPDPNIECEEGIPVYVSEHDQYGDIASHAVYYPDRETLLAEMGFLGQKPFFQYTDGGMQLPG